MRSEPSIGGLKTGPLFLGISKASVPLPSALLSLESFSVDAEDCTGETADSDVAELWTETESDSKSDTESVFLLISSLLSEVSTLDSVSAGTALGLITSEILAEASEVSETNSVFFDYWVVSVFLHSKKS